MWSRAIRVVSGLGIDDGSAPEFSGSATGPRVHPADTISTPAHRAAAHLVSVHTLRTSHFHDDTCQKAATEWREQFSGGPTRAQ